MRRFPTLIAVSVLVLALALAPTARAIPATRTVERPYTQATGDVFVLSCDATVEPTGGIGGACFDVFANERSLAIAPRDVTGLAVGGFYELTTAIGLDPGDVLADGSFCGQIANVAIPSGTRGLLVYVDGVNGPLDCAPVSPGVAIRGTITATFTR